MSTYEQDTKDHINEKIAIWDGWCKDENTGRWISPNETSFTSFPDYFKEPGEILKVIEKWAEIHNPIIQINRYREEEVWKVSMEIFYDNWLRWSARGDSLASALTMAFYQYVK